MRTKTLALSALLGLLGSASVMATNVYSINAVGYINVTLPPGYSIVTCPLICAVDTSVTPNVTNDLNVLFPDGNSAYDQGSLGASVSQFNNGAGFGNIDSAQFGSWTGGGADVTLMPGQAVFFYNNLAASGGSANNMYATFVGSVPTGSLTNTLVRGYNLVGSIVPFSGDLATGAIPNNFGGGPGPGNLDSVLLYDPSYNPAQPPLDQWGYAGAGCTVSYAFGSWSGGNGDNGDPLTTSVTQGFFYNNANSSYNWVETFSISN